MKIVKLCAFIFCLFSFEKTKAQTFLVGDTSCNFVPLHYQINPFSNIPQTSGGFSYTTTYTLDVDGDLTSDFKFNWDVNGYNGGSGTNHTCNLKLTSPSNYEFVCLTTPSNCNSLQVENLANFSTISSNLNWSLITVNKLIYSYCLGFANGCQGIGCGYYFPYGPTNLRIGFRKILTNDTVYGWLRLKTASQLDEVVSYGFKHTLNTNTVTPVFTNTATSMCLGASLSLTASPSGGAFYGNGVSGNMFNSSITGSGAQTIYYSKNCVTTSLALIVNPLPTTAFTNSLSSLCNGDSLVLTATPSGGTFSGPGVFGNKFYSLVTGLGTTPINYYYTDANGCSNSTTLNLNVVSVPNLSISSTSSISCSAQPVTLTATGASNYTWSIGSMNQSIIVSPIAFTIYSVSGSFATGNCPAGIASFSLVAGNSPTVSTTGPIGPLCPVECATITASGATNYLWFPYIYPTQSIVACPNITKTFTVIGTDLNGCKDSAYHTLNVLIPPTVSVFPNSVGICKGDTANFIINGGTGIFQLLNSHSIPIMQVSPPSFYLTYNNYTLAATDSYYLNNYYSTINPMCFVNTPPFYIHDICVNEPIIKESYLQIFPNPNAGEFEIKGDSDETLFISNELGQVINTIKLNAGNNFSNKINSLNNGVYLIRNKFAKQKIVVIK